METKLNSLTPMELIDSLTFLHNANKLSPWTLRQGVKRLTELSATGRLSVQELTIFLRIVQSQNEELKNHVDAALASIEGGLLQHSKEITPSEVAQICAALHLHQDNSNVTPLAQFFSGQYSTLNNWIQTALRVPLEDLAELLKVYRCENIELPEGEENLLENIENALITNHL